MAEKAVEFMTRREAKAVLGGGDDGVDFWTERRLLRAYPYKGKRRRYHRSRVEFLGKIKGKRTLTVSQAAELLGYDPHRMREWVASGILPSSGSARRPGVPWGVCEMLWELRDVMRVHGGNSYLLPEEVACLLGISEGEEMEMVRAGKLTAVNMGVSTDYPMWRFHWYEVRPLFEKRARRLLKKAGFEVAAKPRAKAAKGAA